MLFRLPSRERSIVRSYPTPMELRRRRDVEGCFRMLETASGGRPEILERRMARTEHPQHTPTASTTEVRQGRTGRPVLMVLVCGLVLAFVAWGAAEWWGEATDAPPQQTAIPPAGNNSPAAQTGSTAPAGGTAPTDRTPHASGGSSNQNPVNEPSGNTVTKP